MTQELFQLALNINDPWFVSDLQFDVKSKRLDITIDFKKSLVHFLMSILILKQKYSSPNTLDIGKNTDAKIDDAMIFKNNAISKALLLILFGNYNTP